MTNLVTLGPESLAELTDLLAEANDAPYPLQTLVEEKCFGIGIDGAPHVTGFRDAEGLRGVVVQSGRYVRLLAVAPDARRSGIGTALLRHAEANVTSNRVIVGGEPGNYFVPGISHDDHGTKSFFEKAGYRATSDAIHLVAELRRPWLNDRRALPEGLDVRRATSREQEQILDFIGREFGRLWRFEVSHAFEDRSAIPLYIAWRSDEPVGFSAHDVNNRGGGYYGPAGVLSTLRGGGVGRDLLLCSLADLRDRGYDRTIIPWVSSIEFYEKVAGATLDAKFWTMEKRIA